MAKGKPGPKGGRPPGRRGGGGVGPGPGYRPGSSGGGTKHGSTSGTRKMFAVSVTIFGSFGAVVAASIGYVVWGHVQG